MISGGSGSRNGNATVTTAGNNNNNNNNNAATALYRQRSSLLALASHHQRSSSSTTSSTPPQTNSTRDHLHRQQQPHEQHQSDDAPHRQQHHHQQQQQRHQHPLFQNNNNNTAGTRDGRAVLPAVDQQQQQRATQTPSPLFLMMSSGSETTGGNNTNTNIHGKERTSPLRYTHTTNPRQSSLSSSNTMYAQSDPGVTALSHSAAAATLLLQQQRRYQSSKLYDTNNTAANANNNNRNSTAVYHDRFAAYINRFADLDVRMDHRHSPRRRPTSGDDTVNNPLFPSPSEEKKMDDLSSSTSTLTDRVRIRAMANRKSQRQQHPYEQQPMPVSVGEQQVFIAAIQEEEKQQTMRHEDQSHQYPQQQGSSSRESMRKNAETIHSLDSGTLAAAATTTTMDPYGDPSTNTAGRSSRDFQIVSETVSDVGIPTFSNTNSGSNRTRDLARRFEQRIQKASHYQYTTSNNPHSHSQHLAGSSHQNVPLSADFPVSSNDNNNYYNDQSTGQRSTRQTMHHDHYYQSSNSFRRHENVPANDSHYPKMEDYSSKSTQDHPVSVTTGSLIYDNNYTNLLISSVPAVAPLHVAPYVDKMHQDDENAGQFMESVQPPLSDSDRYTATAPPSSERGLDKQNAKIDSIDRMTRGVRIKKHTTSTGSAIDLNVSGRENLSIPKSHREAMLSDEIVDPRQRERSKSLPPARRNRTTNQGKSWTLSETPVATETSEFPPRLDSKIQQVGRAEIETPLPTNVRELRKILWTDDEHLQVKVRSSFRDIERKDNRSIEPTTLTSGQRNARSLSPKAHRAAQLQDANPNSSAREQKGQLFKSRYYEAARREIGSSSSPSRPSSTKDGKSTDRSVHHSFESVAKSNRTVDRSSENSESNPNITQNIVSAVDMTKSAISSSKAANNSITGTPFESSGNSTEFADKETVESLIRKLGEVNRDDPGAALAQIDAILRQGTIEAAVEHKESSIDVLHVTGGGQTALPVAMTDDGDINVSDESSCDETTVSSITNPTYQEVQANALESSLAGGRPRQSSLGAYSQSHFSLHTPYKIENTLNEKATKVHGTGTPNAIRVNEKSLSALTDYAQQRTILPLRVLDPCSPPPLENSKRRPDGMTIFEKIGSILSPSKTDTSTTHSAEIEEKIKRWDDMSTGVIPVAGSHGHYNLKASKTEATTQPEEILSTGTTTELGSIITEKRDVSPGTLRRAHPWDASIPVRMGHINVRDTSMDCGDGIEASYTPKYEKAHFSTDRSVDFPSKGTQKSRIKEEKIGDKVAAVHIQLSNESTVKTNPVISRRQKEHTSVLSDAFDSAWVNLPSSNYFGNGRQRQSNPHVKTTGTRDEISQLPTGSDSLSNTRQRNDLTSKVKTPLSQRQNSDQSLSPDTPNSLDDTKRSSNRSYTHLGSGKSPSASPYPRHAMRSESRLEEKIRDMSQADSESRSRTLDLSLTDNSTKNRGRGLRGFLKRKQAAAAAGKMVTSADQSTFTSATSTRRSNYASSLPSNQIIKESGSLEGAKSFVEGRGRKTQTDSPARSRARSLDERRIHNPNIARKYQRLLRVYNKDVSNL